MAHLALALVVIVVLIFLGFILKEAAKASEDAAKSVLKTAAIVVFVALAIIGFQSPGLIAMYMWHEHVMPDLDRAQLWTFATLASIASYTVWVTLAFSQARQQKALSAGESGHEPERTALSPWGIGLAMHALIFILTVGTLLVAHFGFKSSFPLRFLQAYFGFGM